MLLEFFDQHLWAAVLKRAITLLVLAAFGVHAYVQYRRRGGKMPTPQRWVYFAFSVALGFAVVVNFAMMVLAAEFNVRKGPFNTGIFSLMIFILYLIFIGGMNRRVYYWK